MTGPLSQRECAGICRIIQGLNVAANTNCRDEVWEILNELTRLECATSHTDTMQALRSLWDSTLSFTHWSLRAKGMDHKAFWASHSHWELHCSLPSRLPSAMTQTLRRSRDAMTVARTTSVGQKLFGKASQLVTSRKLEADVAAARAPIPSPLMHWWR